MGLVLQQQAGGNQPAHAVAQDEAGQPGATGVNHLPTAPDTVEIILELTDKHAVARGFTVANVVRGDDKKTFLHQGIGHMLVASTVLAQSMDQEHRGNRLPVGLPAPVAHPGWQCVQ